MMITVNENIAIRDIDSEEDDIHYEVEEMKILRKLKKIFKSNFNEKEARNLNKFFMMLRLS